MSWKETIRKVNGETLIKKKWEERVKGCFIIYWGQDGKWLVVKHFQFNIIFIIDVIKIFFNLIIIIIIKKWEFWFDWSKYDVYFFVNKKWYFL